MEQDLNRIFDENRKIHSLLEQKKDERDLEYWLKRIKEVKYEIERLYILQVVITSTSYRVQRIIIKELINTLKETNK